MNSRVILGLAGLSLAGAVIAGYWGFTLTRQPVVAPVAQVEIALANSRTCSPARRRHAPTDRGVAA